MAGGISFGTRVRAASRALVGIFNENSLKAAYGLLSGVLPGGQGLPPTRGTADYLRAYSQMPWLRAVTGRIGTATARADWQLFVAKRPGERARRIPTIQRASMQHRRKLLRDLAQEGELTQITDHVLLNLLHEANEFQTGFDMRKVTQLHLDLVGEAFWMKERGPQNEPVGLWPIPPHWIVATPTPAFRFYRVQFRAWRGVIPDTEFVWFSDVDPLNPYGRGSGSAMALGDELDTDEYAARHTKAFFYNQGRPDLLVWPKGAGLDPSNIARLEEDWLSKTQGFWRAFKPYFLTREVEVKELAQNFKSQEIVKLRQFERDAVLQHYGMPPEALGVLENSNRATIDNADYFMSRYVVEPRLEKLRQVMQERLVPEFDDRLILDYVSPVQEDRERQLKAAEAAPWALTVDEWRALAGKAPLEDEDNGKLHMLPPNSKFGEIEKTPDPPPVPPGGMPGVPGGPQARPPAEDPEPKPPKAAALRGIKFEGLRAVVDKDIEAAEEAGDAALAIALTRAAEEPDDLPPSSAAAGKLEPALVRALVRVWTDHATRINRAALAALLDNSAVVVGDVLEVLDVPGLGVAQTQVLEPALARGVHAGMVLADADLRAVLEAGKASLIADLTATNPEAAAWARQHAAALVAAPAEVRQVIRELIARSIAEGIPPYELAKLLQHAIGLTEQQAKAVASFRQRLVEEGVATATIDTRVARYAAAQRRLRAVTIARTELIDALTRGQQVLWDTAVKSGVINASQFEQRWLITDDEALEAECESLSTVRAPIGGEFVSPRSGSRYHGPPAHPRCRCAVGLVPKVAVPTTAPVAAAVEAPAVEVHNHLGEQDAVPVRRERTIVRDGDGLVAKIVDVYGKYDPEQPREPAGSPTGGQWTDGGGGAAADEAKPEETPKEGYEALMHGIAQPDGGFTWSPVTGSPDGGYALSIYKGREATFDVKSVTPKDLASYAKSNWDLISKPGNYLGAWHNPDDGKLYLDVSTVVGTEAEARALAKEHSQLAYFDLKGGKSVAMDSGKRLRRVAVGRWVEER